MTAPRDRQPVETFDQKMSALSRDPLDEVERDRLAGWPDRWPNNQTGADQDSD